MARPVGLPTSRRSSRLLAPAPDEWFTAYEVSTRVEQAGEQRRRSLGARRRRRVRPMELSSVPRRHHQRVGCARRRGRARRPRRAGAVVSRLDVADLVAHVGEVQQWARIHRRAARVRADLPPHPARPRPPVPSSSPGSASRRPRSSATLAATDPSTPMWTFTDDQTARFWFRRQAHEVAVHRWDARAHRGRSRADRRRARSRRRRRVAGPAPVRGPTPTGSSAPARPIHLHCTDTHPRGRVGRDAGPTRPATDACAREERRGGAGCGVRSGSVRARAGRTDGVRSVRRRRAPRRASRARPGF